MEAWLSQVSPLDKFAVVDGKLTFEDLNNGHRDGEPRQYTVRWATWDGNGHTEQLPDATGSDIPEFRNGDTKYLAATVACEGTDRCEKPVTVYLRRCNAGLEVVGIDR